VLYYTEIPIKIGLLSGWLLIFGVDGYSLVMLTLFWDDFMEMGVLPIR
jgi:hypothetical protein